MGGPAIRIEGLGKRYRIRGSGPDYDTLGDALGRLARAPLRLLGRAGAAAAPASFWALRGVTFEVMPGEAVGLIGRNGAGKSTLLRILSRVTDPTEGRAVVRGTTGALLEVGTGFHPELTGRENVFLNGAILGMRRAEVSRCFDDIVAFAQMEQFIDMPAKHYSSGMYMRLAFAVAAHLETRILFVDEVLAVGDAEFQRRCLAKMERAGAQGRTVIFVSHDMGSITRLCTRAVLLDRGSVVADGPAAEVVHRYLRGGAMHGAAVREWPTPGEAPGDDVARLHAVRVLDEAGRPAPEVDIRKPVRIEVEFWNLRPEVRPSANLYLYNQEGTCLFVTNDFVAAAWKAGPREKGLVRSTCSIPGNFLAEGLVTAQAAVSSYGRVTVHALERDAVAFTVVDRSQGDGARGPYAGRWPGVLRPMLEWDLRAVDPEVPSVA
jgi:lipopolysaccharide transport system ATP-binding protein